MLAAVALSHPQPISADRIAALVWHDGAPTTARKTIQNHVARIRRAVDGLVDTSSHGYRFAPAVRIDRESTADSDEPLADLPDTPEIEAHRHRIRTQAIAADEQRWSERLHAGATPELVGELVAATAAEPYRERRWYLLASAHSQLGARREALQACGVARRHLAEIGLVPGELLRHLEQRLVDDGTTSDAAVPAIRPVVHPDRDEPFVGRADELSRIAAAWERVADSGRPQLVVVQGVAGAGKTRLVDEFCRRLPDGTTVLVARHRPDGGRAFDPIVDAIRPLITTHSIVEPSAGRVSADSPSRAIVDATRSALRFLADRPAVLVLDDIHWTSSDAIEALRDAVDGIESPTLLIATARPADSVPEPWAPLAAVVAVHHLTVGELTRDELGSLVDAVGLAAPPDVDLVYARTAGLPYYASELLRLARLSGRFDVLDVPTAIRTWMHTRLASLDDDDAETIRIAAVAGPVIDTDLLERCTGRGVVERCDRLVAAGLLAGDAGTGTLRFGHELSRDAIVDSLGPATLAALHRQIGEALAEQSDVEPAFLAHHLVRAGPAVAPEAAEAATQAGLRDLSSGAWRQAETWFRTAIELAPSNAVQARALAGLGRALVGTERFEESESVLRTAIDMARELGLATVQASATLALAGRAGRGAGVGADDAEVTSLLRSALDHLGRAPDPGGNECVALAAALERELAIVLLLDTDAARERVELLGRQLARARSLDPPDPGELASALLVARYALLDGPDLPTRLANVDEVLALPFDRLGPERLLTAHCYRHEDLVRSGRRQRAAAALADAEGLVRRYPHPYWNWVTRTWRVLEHIDAGDLELAEHLAAEAAASRPGIGEAVACHGVNLVNIRLYQGRAGEVIALLRAAVEASPHIPTYRAVLALCLVEAGDPEAGHEHVRHFTDAGLRNLPHDTNWLLAVSVLAHASAAIGDEDAAQVLVPELEPFAGQWVVLNCYGGGGAVWGPVDHAVARLDRLLGRHDLATARFASAAAQAAGARLVGERIEADRQTGRPSPLMPARALPPVRKSTRPEAQRAAAAPPTRRRRPTGRAAS